MYLVRAGPKGGSASDVMFPVNLTPPGGSSQLFTSTVPAAAGKRVVLLLRHGQCCHEGEGDELKTLTLHGHKQAEETARYIKGLFDNIKLPAQRALLQSTSRRARETAAKIVEQMPR